MASFIYNSAKVKLGDGNIDWDTDTIMCTLHTSAYTPNKDSDVFFSAATNEISGGGYTSGGYAIANTAVTQDNTNDRALYDGDDIQITGLTATFRYIVVWKDTTVDATSPLIALIDLGSDVTLTAGVYDITWPASGVFTLT